MIKNNFFEFNWHLVTIEDPSFLTGPSIFDMIQFMLRHVKVKFIIFDDMLGAAQNGLMVFLHEEEGEIFNLKEFSDILCKVQQFEWGNFFLFKEYPDSCDSTKKTYLKSIKEADITIRAVDGQYFYIYTPHGEIVEALTNQYTIESVKTSSLEHLDYPE